MKTAAFPQGCLADKIHRVIYEQLQILLLNVYVPFYTSHLYCYKPYGNKLMNFASKFCQAQQQPQLRLRLSLFPDDPTTHPPGTSTVLVSKANSGLYCDKVYFFKTISISLHAQ